MAADVRLLDCGDGRRLERLGSRVVDRPAGAAAGAPRAPGRWRDADLRFVAGAGWRSPSGRVDPSAPWPVVVAGLTAELTMELRPTASGGVGLYPEHIANLEWLGAAVAARLGVHAGGHGGEIEAAPQVLNLFAHTGLVTLALARAGARVAHVDAARSAVAWARRNAELSGLADRPVRWLVDDATAFVAREARRGRRYDGIVLDPPSSGIGPVAAASGNRRWTLERDLERLLDGCAAVARPDAFLLVTAHTTGLDPDALADAVAGRFAGPEPAVLPLALEAESGARLELGWAIGLDPLASRRDPDPRDGAP